jgi:hypothetical protein
VDGRVGVHRADDTQVVGVLPGEGREQLAHLHPALAVGLELERGSERGARWPFGFEMNRQPLAVVFRQLGFRIEGVHLRRAAVGEDLDDVFRARRKMRRLRRERIPVIHSAGGGFAEQRGESEHAKTGAAGAEHLAAGHGIRMKQRIHGEVRLGDC